jgi:hypothetical protein
MPDGNNCRGVRHPSDTHLTPLAFTIGSNAVPLEICELTGERADIQVSLRQHTPIEQFVKDAKLKMRREFGVKRARCEPFLLKLSKPRGKPGEGGLTKFGERFFKSRIDRVRLAQDDARGVTVSGKKLEPATKAGFENGTRTE